MAVLEVTKALKARKDAKASKERKEIQEMLAQEVRKAVLDLKVLQVSQDLLVLMEKLVLRVKLAPSVLLETQVSKELMGPEVLWVPLMVHLAISVQQVQQDLWVQLDLKVLPVLLVESAILAKLESLAARVLLDLKAPMAPSQAQTVREVLRAQEVQLDQLVNQE